MNSARSTVRPEPHRPTILPASPNATTAPDWSTMTPKMTSADALHRLAELPVATVYEAAGKLGDVAPHIRPLVDGVRLAGPAFTLKTMPGDNLAVFAAIDAAPPGSVLVIDGGG